MWCTELRPAEEERDRGKDCERLDEALCHVRWGGKVSTFMIADLLAGWHDVSYLEKR